MFHREKLKKNTMDELGRLGFERLEVKPIFRNYLSLLARCHNNLRGKAAPFVADAESGLKKTREGFIASNSTPVGCQGKNLKVSCETDGILEEYYVDSVLVETLKMHLSSWKGLADHWRKYASSRVTVQNDAYQGDKAQDIWIN